MADLAQQLEGLAVEIDTDALWAVQENDIAALLRRAKGEITALRAQLADARAQERERCGKVVERHATTCPMEHMPTVVAILDAIRALSPTPHQEKKE